MYFDAMTKQPASPKCFIYALHSSSTTSKHVYIGKTAQGERRFLQHESPVDLKRYARLPRAKFIQSLYKRGLKPEFVILEVCASTDDLNEAERHWIASFRMMGIPLLNLTDGGDGVHGFEFTDESRAKMSVSQTARSTTEEGRAWMSEMSLMQWDDAAREKKRLEMTGKKQSAEVIEKSASKRRGQKRSPETCANSSAAASARWAVPGYREAQSASQAVAQRDPEVRAKKRAAAEAQWTLEARAAKSAQVTAYYAAKKEVQARKDEEPPKCH